MFFAFSIPAYAAPPEAKPIAEVNQSLGKGINFGNALEAPSEGEWGFRIEERYFDDVKQAGFESIRVPVKWSAHAAKTAPFAIEPAFAERVDWVLENATKRGLNVVLNIHHYDELYDAPEQQEERFLALWSQLAKRYADQPGSVVFELLNEPRNPLTPEKWNALFPKALAIVRESNPKRAVIVGPGNWNNIDSLAKLELPDDENLIVTVHYYSPFHFTHQGASWAEGSDKWLGMKWGNDADRAAVRKDLEKAATWGREHNRPIYLGEFGAYSKADMASREKWTTFVRSEAARLGMSWAYWEFGSGFGAFDPSTNQWRRPLKQALVGTK
ncbi:MAG: glycoside hydrolase family 5 protein [Planctomycetaceae bacterium]|nr:glycoside hydrolase family 5 protein [Planctomycetaceae bacterium]